MRKYSFVQCAKWRCGWCEIALHEFGIQWRNVCSPWRNDIYINSGIPQQGCRCLMPLMGGAY